MTKVMITGHRPERLKGREAEITEWINNTIKSLTDEDECITGCAKGVDTLFAFAAMNKNIPLVCAFPYKHELSEPEQQMHDYAKEVHWETESWYKACYLNRDKWMVDRADIVLVVWEGSLEQEEVMYNLENNLYPEDYTKQVNELLDKYKKE